MNARKGDWIRIRAVILSPKDRSPNLPEDTRRVPLEMWTKGTLQNESAALGDHVTVETASGRTARGEFIEAAPAWHHGFGEYIPQLDEIGRRLKGRKA